MASKMLAGLMLAASCLMATAAIGTASAEDALITNGPQASPGDRSTSRAAAINNRESAMYERLLATNPAFRRARMAKECGPINDPQLHASCMASFGQAEPSYGSSAMPNRMRHERGAGE